MSDTDIDKINSSTSTGSISTSVLVFVLLVGAVAIIVYILQQQLANNYPISPFNYGDTVVIRPAILSGDNINQYLEQSATIQLSNAGQPCLIPYDYGPNAYAVTFTGDKSNTRSQWILNQFSSASQCEGVPGGCDANQSLVYGLGNRFYLQNRNNPSDPTGRLRYQRLNEGFSGLCYSTTPAVIGYDGSSSNCSWFESDLLVYFLPTNYPNLYFILFPSCSSGVSGVNSLNPNTTTQPNDGIISVRPWGANFGQNNLKLATGCVDCSSNGTFNPWVNGDPTQGLQPNVPIMNHLPADNLFPPYQNANVLLFEVVKV
ncbi:MAG TPA: hypothetical protein VLG50_07860 [Candidatus Saccharimonadales bacterium]|nr:hypothetical protein [Candidatus Saccharimonadales bacterium]